MQVPFLLILAIGFVMCLFFAGNMTLERRNGAAVYWTVIAIIAAVAMWRVVYP